MSKRPPTSALEDVLAVNKTVHEPARLVLLAILNAVANAEFAYLLEQTGLTQGNLSAHLAKLETAGLVDVSKEFAGKRPRTTLSITSAGRAELKMHGRRMARFLRFAGLG